MGFPTKTDHFGVRKHPFVARKASISFIPKAPKGPLTLLLQAGEVATAHEAFASAFQVEASLA